MDDRPAPRAPRLAGPRLELAAALSAMIDGWTIRSIAEASWMALAAQAAAKPPSDGSWKRRFRGEDVNNVLFAGPEIIALGNPPDRQRLLGPNQQRVTMGMCWTALKT